MTDFANLVISVDARQPKDAKAELDRLAAAGDKAGKSADNLSREWVKASSAAGKLRLEQISARMESDKLAASQRNVVVGMDKSSGSSRMLAMQLSQVAQQAATGTNVLQALAIQLPDIAGGMALAGGSAGRFAAFLGGPWGIAIASAVAALSPLIVNLYKTKDAADAATGAMQRVRAQRIREMEEARVLTDIQKEYNKTKQRESELLREIALRSGGRKQADGTPMFAYAQAKELAAVQAEMRELSADMQAKIKSVAPLVDNFGKTNDKAAEAVGRHSAAMGKASGSARSYGAAIKGATKEIELNIAALNAAVYESFGDSDKIAKQFEQDLANKVNSELDGMRVGVTTVNEAWTDWNAELRKTVDLLDSMGAGKLGNIGAALAGLASGDFSGVRGKGGALLQILGGMSWKNSEGQTTILREEIVKGLDKVFGETGSFAKTMNGLLQGAGTGLAIGSALYPGNKTAQTVGAIAGAMANAAGTAVGGPAAGAAASVVASTIWSSIAKAFTATKKGVATFDGSGLVSTRGNSKSRIAGATSAGNSAIEALAQIADAFGADIGDASFSLGIRKKSYVLDPTGQGRTKGEGVINFGKDSEAAVRAAIKDAISDGVFEGLSAGVERLLKGEGDIEKQLKKALDFQGVFDELSQRTDPTGFGLGQLDKQFGKLRDIFAEAGASTEEYAKLEELFQLKRTEIINEGSRRSRELEIEIMRLTGDGIGALNAERAMEKEGLSDVLVAQIDRRNALIDEAIATEQARVVAEERRQLEYRMAQALGDEEKILTMRREDDLAVTSELNKVYLQQVQAAEAAAAAVAKAAAAQNAAVSSLQGLPGMIGGGVLGAAGNPAVLGALGMFAGGDVTGARNALASYISNTVGTALPGATSAVQSAAIDQVIASLSPSGPVNIGRGVTTGQLGGNKKPAGNLSDGKLAQRYADAEAARVDKLDDLHSRLADAYDREKKALEDLVEPFRKVREELIAYKEDLLGGMRSPGQTLQSLQVKLMAAAASKDASVLATIPGLGRDFDSLARSRSSTKADYMRQQAFLVGIVDQAIGTAGGQVNYNEEQLQRLDKSVDLQIEIKKEQETTNDLLRQLLDENKGERSEQLQLGLKIEQWTHGAHKALRGATRGGNTMEVELDA